MTAFVLVGGVARSPVAPAWTARLSAARSFVLAALRALHRAPPSLVVLNRSHRGRSKKNDQPQVSSGVGRAGRARIMTGTSRVITLVAGSGRPTCADLPSRPFEVLCTPRQSRRSR